MMPPKTPNYSQHVYLFPLNSLKPHYASPLCPKSLIKYKFSQSFENQTKFHRKRESKSHNKNIWSINQTQKGWLLHKRGSYEILYVRKNSSIKWKSITILACVSCTTLIFDSWTWNWCWCERMEHRKNALKHLQSGEALNSLIFCSEKGKKQVNGKNMAEKVNRVVLRALCWVEETCWHFLG